MRFLTALFLVCLSTPLLAEVKVGDPAPDFSMAGSDGNAWSLESLAGKPFVIAFFPKAFTGG